MSGDSVSRHIRVTCDADAKTSISTAGLDQPQLGPRDAFDQAFLRGAPCSLPPEDPARTISVADLFSGCGGLSLGVREACAAIGYQFSPVLAIDIFGDAVDVYNSNFSPKKRFAEDITELIDGGLKAPQTTEEKKLIRALEGDQIEILLAGPPCQGYSNLNNHTRRDDQRNWLYTRVARATELLRPKVIMIENVPAIIHGKEQGLNETREHLEYLGYEVDTGEVDLSELGVPQSRSRHVLVATSNNSISISRAIERFRITNTRNLAWAISDLEEIASSTAIDQPTRHSEANMKRIRYLMQNEEYDLPNSLRPKCHRNGHTYKSMYGRLRYDAPAQTITTGYGSPGQGRYIHPTKPRTITAHEAARLQFFPDKFDFSKARTRGALASLIGNAVPMNLSFALALDYFVGQQDGS